MISSSIPRFRSSKFSSEDVHGKCFSSILCEGKIKCKICSDGKLHSQVLFSPIFSRFLCFCRQIFSVEYTRCTLSYKCTWLRIDFSILCTSFYVPFPFCYYALVFSPFLSQCWNVMYYYRAVRSWTIRTQNYFKPSFSFLVLNYPVYNIILWF